MEAGGRAGRVLQWRVDGDGGGGGGETLG